jgi:uncharacterized membrane protein
LAEISEGTLKDMNMAFPTIIFVFGVIFWLMIAAAAVVVVVWVVRSRSLTPTTAAPTHEAPLDILARRFASGEIDADEYKRSRDLLTGGDKKP